MTGKGGRAANSSGEQARGAADAPRESFSGRIFASATRALSGVASGFRTAPERLRSIWRNRRAGLPRPASVAFRAGVVAVVMAAVLAVYVLNTRPGRQGGVAGHEFPPLRQEAMAEGRGENRSAPRGQPEPAGVKPATGVADTGGPGRTKAAGSAGQEGTAVGSEATAAGVQQRAVGGDDSAGTGAPAGAAGKGTTPPGNRAEPRPVQSAAGTKPGIEPDPSQVLAGLRWPVAGKLVTPHGWAYSDTFADWRYHRGIDIEIPPGTPVRVALAGRVVSVERSDELGLMMVVAHPGGIRTVYASVRSPLFRPGENVVAGQQIAEVGDSGWAEAGSGSRLHFEVVVGEESVDPLRFLRAR